MNPGLKLFLILIISLKMSLTPNLTANIVIIVASLNYLAFKHLSFKKLLLIFLIPLSAALVVFITTYYFTPGHSLYQVNVLFMRVYAYIFLGTTFTETISAPALARSLE